MYENIGVAVVGTGFMGPVHIEALRRLGIPVVGVLGSSEAKSISARDALGVEKAYASYDEIIADPKATSVHIGTPNSLHFDMASTALRAGKHVMCEKPLAMDTKESGELVRIAADSSGKAGVNYNIRFYPLNLHSRKLISSGEIGEVRTIFGGYVQDWLLYDTDYNWRVLSDKGGELRAVSDIGTHWIDLITSITGLEVEAVFADLATFHKIRKRPLGEVDTFSGGAGDGEYEEVLITTDDAGAVLFRMKGGAKASLWVSQMTAGRKNCLRYEIAGSKKALFWNSEQPNDLWLGSREGANSQIMKDPGAVDPAVGHYVDYPGGHNEGYPDSFKMCFRSFYDAVAGRESEFSYPTFKDGHREIQLCEAILESHRAQRWVELS
jgi:predicted dehydrogenase